MSGGTLFQLLEQSALRFGARPALREKRRGIWHEITYARYLDEARSQTTASPLIKSLVALFADRPPESVLAAARKLQAQGELFSLSFDDAPLYAAALEAGLCVSFPESPATLLADLREVGPHSLFAPAAFWEEQHALVRAKMAAAAPFNQFIYRKLLPRGGWLAEFALFNPLRDRLGLSRLRRAAALGKLAPESLGFFRAIGVPLQEEAA